jgi:E3 ubiquitin-protein ligase DMA1/2
VWHYKCIRPILNGPGYPNLLCPNCRASIDLEADVEEADSDWEDDLQEAIEASKKDTKTDRIGGATSIAFAPSSHAKDVPMNPEAVTAVVPIIPSPSSSPSSAPPSVRGAAHHAANTTPGVDTDGDYDMVDATHVTDGTNGTTTAVTGFPPPRPIPTRAAPPAPITVTDPSSVGANLTPTPPRAIPGRSATAAAVIAGNGIPEGPVTPRNDAGPFVLDGGAGRPPGAT